MIYTLTTFNEIDSPELHVERELEEVEWSEKEGKKLSPRAFFVNISLF